MPPHTEETGALAARGKHDVMEGDCKSKGYLAGSQRWELS